MALDELPNEGRTEIEVTAGTPTRTIEHAIGSTVTFVGFGEYGHCVLNKDANGLLEFIPLGYRPSPYPLKNVDVILMQHPDRKTWAIVDEFGPNKVFYQNNQTDGRLVYQQLTVTQSVSDRINEKALKGYVYVGNATYDALKRSIKL